MAVDGVAEEADDAAGAVVVGKPSPSRRGGRRWSHWGVGVRTGRAAPDSAERD